MNLSQPPSPNPSPAPNGVLHDRVLAWYDEHARDLPWRSEQATAWGVMVSEFMLQQTPVSRVLPVWMAWMESWPTPADLAAAGPGAAVRGWGRLGYPRRALRLHEAATTIVANHGGQVPSSYHALLALPGVGDYTASAIASFAFGQRHVVLDTNVRRVLARVVDGAELPAVSPTRGERTTAEALLPQEPGDAAAWAVGVMELGALVCTATSPRCGACPVGELCRWATSGRPAYEGPPRRGQTYAGTDRQCRGRLLEVLRRAPGPVHRKRLDAVWSDPTQRERSLATLTADGLAVELPGDLFTLPG